MNRSLSRWLLAILLAGLVFLPATADIGQIGPNEYIVGVPSEEFVHFAAPETRGRQRMQNWCWAACIQMVLNYHGLHVDQQQIVTRVFGAAIDRPASGGEILSALRGWVADPSGRHSAIYADPYNLDAATVVSDLQQCYPLIVGLRGPRGAASGHAYVLTAAYVHINEYQQPIIYRVILRDPYPTQQSKIEMPINEFNQRYEFGTRVYVQPL
ncbi:MAG: hypothetical protein KC910_16995 [Candidatus Eremiobacteraeota bacterium]|nr:hypothetical protein [Candidatus Eremiobacteraeota bacterium]